MNINRNLISVLWLVLFMFIPHNVLSQTIIEGDVINTQGKTAGTYITASPKGSKNILCFSNIDNNGRYKLEFKTTVDSVTIVVSGMTIVSQTYVVDNRSQRLDIKVKERSMQLKEVSVRAKKIRQNGDTLNYTVGAYQKQGDRVIGDVLKRMPGIEVSANGGIKYNGKSIVKFYVEDMDLLQGRYGLATNNINAQDVATVQVLEKHQPVKALQDKTITDDVAINLKLKDSAKGTIAINSMFGGGVQQAGDWRLGARSLNDEHNVIGQNPLWAMELVGMYFGKKRQNMTLYKGNNIGDDVTKELTQHYSGINSVGLYPFCPMAAIMPNGSGLPQKRTFDNHTHIVTMNHLEKLPNDKEIGINVAYNNDCIRREGCSESDLFVSDDKRLQTTESLISETKVNNLNIQNHYCKNASDGYWTNVMKFDVNWNNDEVDGILNSQLSTYYSQLKNYGDNHVRQYFDRPQLSVSNTFNTLRNFGKHTLNFHFSAGYSQRPNTLNVCVDSILQGTSTTYQQDITSRNIVGDFNTSVDFRFGSFTLKYGVLAYAGLHGIVTDLNGFDTGSYSPRNDLWYNIYEFDVAQEYKYERHGFRISLGCPLTLYSQTLDDRIRKDCHGYVHLLVTPTFDTNYEWREWSVNANASYYKNVGDPGGIYSGYIMNNYRSFQRSYVEQLSETERMGVGGCIRYRNAITATFINVNGGYSHARDNQIYGVNYMDAISMIQAVDRVTKANNYSLKAECSQGLDWLDATLRVSCGYVYSTNERLISDMVYPFHSRTTSIGAGGSFKPLPWMNVSFGSGYSWHVTQTNASSDDLAKMVRLAAQSLKVNFYVTKKLTISTSTEDNYNNLTTENRHVWFCDASAKLKLKHFDIELHLDNLLDQRQYTRINYNGLDVFTQTSQLRPRSIVGTVRFKLL